MPSFSSRSVVSLAARSQPETSRSYCASTSAMPLMPAPPMPTKCACRRPARRWKIIAAPPPAPRRGRRSPPRRPGAPAARAARPIGEERRPVGEETPDLGGEPLGSQLAVGDDGRRAAPARADARSPPGGRRRARAARAASARPAAAISASVIAPARESTSVARRHRRRHVVDEGNDLDAGGARQRRAPERAALVEVPGAALVQHLELRQRLPHAGDGGRQRAVQLPCPLAAAEDQEPGRGVRARAAGRRRTRSGSARRRRSSCSAARGRSSRRRSPRRRRSGRASGWRRRGARSARRGAPGAAPSARRPPRPPRRNRRCRRPRRRRWRE